ncbi:GNAT family N-acetyltransferase [Acetobacterium bakii]|uniref:N-acetyltransferase domain-containing protein n=1 Tax=Acetobacterium bakii TaxID=52689 RepID=A0A0L6U0J2_9FIRM|nr:GNAT family N-acetyltransferase [Acetobacterium bakii]KNZ42041.1 hypothetical protein AKG39_08905 [Acetobacterium bakii]
MKKVYEKDGFTYYEYKPTMFKPFYLEMETYTFRERIRFLLSYFVGYKVFYMMEGTEYIGYCVVEKSGNGRYRFIGKKDIIVGPIFIKNQFRGRGLAGILNHVVLDDLGLSYIYAWNYVDKLNTKSVKAAPKAGFEYVSDAVITGIGRKLALVEGDTGDFRVMRYKNMESV